MNIIEYLRQNEGNVFYTVKKLPFTFVVENNSIQPIRDGNKINGTINLTTIMEITKISTKSGQRLHVID